MPTLKSIYIKRREFIQQYLQAGLLISSGMSTRKVIATPKVNITDKIHALGYNNYYEFSTNKKSVSELSKALTLTPWPVTINGTINGNVKITLDEIKQLPQHQRTYRFRCVEGWSMVVPWSGILLKDLLLPLLPNKNAEFVQFTSLFRPSEMIGQRRNTLPWPYTEGLRIDEALHPLTMLVTGMYGEALAPQCGAPLRLIVPWKYGFKSIKAVHEIAFVENQPETTWQNISPGEYGFYGNVNPRVAHPRWSQRRELPLGEFKKIKTLPFNGYENEVSQLYEGMDLEKYY